MTALEEYLSELDNSSFDNKDQSKIKEGFQEISDSLKDKDETDSEKQQVRWEYEVLIINASIERGLEPVTEGVDINEAGEAIKISWPNIKSYSEKEFTYIKNRYAQTKNLYLKCKYGLVLFISRQRADNAFVLELLDSLMKLSESYFQNKKEYKYSDLYFVYSLKDALNLAIKRKSVVEIGEKYKLILQFIYETLLKLRVDKTEGKFTLSSLTNIVIQHFNEFSSNFSISVLLETNWSIAKEMSEYDKHGAIDISNINLKLARLLKAENIRWHQLMAECYTKLADERKGMVAPEFYVSAISHYKLIKDTDKIKELQLLLTDAKTKMDFGKVEYAIPEEEVSKINEEIKNEIESNDSDFIVNRLAQGVYLPRFSEVKAVSKSSGFTMAQIITTSFYDKHGNKTMSVNPQNSDEDVSFYSAFDLHFQIPSQVYLKYFIESIRAEKINYEIVNAWLEKTWYGEKLLRVYNGYTKEISVLELLSPLLKLLFEDFSKAITDLTYSPNYVCILDSIALKVEYILRMLCDEKLNIPTSYINSDGTLDEKTLTALVYDLKIFIKEHPSIEGEMKEALLDDLIFIDFVLNSKAGKNIRNRVAHAHLDLDEYSPLKIVLVFAVILKLSLLKTGDK